MEEMKVENMRYGLVVVDKRDLEKSQDGMVTILHFCGFQYVPTKEDAQHLYDELATDEEFGVTDIIEHIGIYTAPESIVNEYREDILAGRIGQINPAEEEK